MCNPSMDMMIDKMEIAKDAMFMQQSSEWGMRVFQLSFLQIKNCIAFSSEVSTNS